MQVPRDKTFMLEEKEKKKGRIRLLTRGEQQRNLHMMPQAGNTPPAKMAPKAPKRMNFRSGRAICLALLASKALSAFSSSSLSSFSSLSSSLLVDFTRASSLIAVRSTVDDRFCDSTSLLYRPLGFCISSSWVPISLTLPPATNAIRSALRIVERRWAMTIVVLSWLDMSESSASWTTCSESVSLAKIKRGRAEGNCQREIY